MEKEMKKLLKKKKAKPKINRERIQKKVRRQAKELYVIDTFKFNGLTYELLNNRQIRHNGNHIGIPWDNKSAQKTWKDGNEFKKKTEKSGKPTDVYCILDRQDQQRRGGRIGSGTVTLILLKIEEDGTTELLEFIVDYQQKICITKSLRNKDVIMNKGLLRIFVKNKEELKELKDMYLEEEKNTKEFLYSMKTGKQNWIYDWSSKY